VNVSGSPFRAYDYAYDPAGNRKQKVVTVDGSPTTTNYTFNALNQLTGDGVNSYTYDDNGNLTSDGVNAHTWDRANRLLSMGGHSYAYNGLGQRVGQTVDSVATQYLLDVQPELWKVLAATSSGQTERYLHGPLGIHAQEDVAGNWRWMVPDALGSVRGVVNEDLSHLESRQYTPYGEEYGATGSEQTEFGFTGEQVDANGLVYLRARYYQPGMGRFFQMDPSRQEERLYIYAASNPMLHIDPSGKICIVGHYFSWPFPEWTCEEGAPISIHDFAQEDTEPNADQTNWQELVTSCEDAIQEAIDWIEWQWILHDPCGLSADPNCGLVRGGIPSPHDITENLVQQYYASSWGGLDYEQLRQILGIMDAVERLATINDLVGPRPEPIEHNYHEFATLSRQRQLEIYAEYYFGDLGVDLVYTDTFGIGHYGRSVDPGDEFPRNSGIIYERGAIVVSENAFQEGWDQVGVTIYHEMLEQDRGSFTDLTHDEIYDLEQLYRDWFNQDPN
jgi:RHS repeat-associated protein